MSSVFEAWRRHLWLWALPLGFCVLGLLGLTFYRSAFAGHVQLLEGKLQKMEDKLTQARDEQLVIEEFLSRFKFHQKEVLGLHRDRFQTEEQRFTRVIQDVKKLARQAGLRPMSLSYPRKIYGDHHLVQRNIIFSVQGTYDQLRTFINFLELTEHFVTLNSVALGEGGGDGRRNPTLGIKLVLSTIFTTRRFKTLEAPEARVVPEAPEALALMPEAPEAPA